ncbi:unnamed protein product [Staurois parvus]|uniref:Uncharacterized protein n=1 Tax=Staurois parvus TaxID=386267 RepID=A0ABN9B597_9NEOB|nr:unnamed protein product [Staurois parvus]
MQMSAVDLRINAHFTHLGRTPRVPKPEVVEATSVAWRQQQWGEAIQHPMKKWNHPAV